MTSDGATITLFVSKTAQGGDAPESIYIQPGIALKARRRWIETGDITEATPSSGPLANAAGSASPRLTGGSIAPIVKARCAAAGLEPHEFSGHSLQAGMVTSAAENGVAKLEHRAYIEAQVGCASPVHQAGRKAPAFADQRHRLVVDQIAHLEAE